MSRIRTDNRKWLEATINYRRVLDRGRREPHMTTLSCPRRSWRCARRLCWGARMARTTSRSPRSCGVHPDTVSKWRSRFLRLRLEGSTSPGRAGRHRSHGPGRGGGGGHAGGDAQECHALVAGFDGQAQRLVQVDDWADLARFEFKPHRADTFKLSADRCSSRRSSMSWACITTRQSGRWCCTWMRSPRSKALDRSQPVLPMMPGMPERRMHDYVRTGAPACSPPSTSKTAPSSASCTAITAPPSSESSWPRSTRRSRPRWTSI